MKSIQFLGASSGEVTGSSYLLTSQKDTKVLVDFGMFQGSDEIVTLNYEPLLFKPSELAGVFITHAHLDHCGRLPLLIYGGYMGKIYMTSPTRSLVEIILTDSAHIAEYENKDNPLYTMEEVYKILKMIEIVEYETPIKLEDLTVTFKDAGHILGSASIEVVDTTNNKKIVFSGDLGNTPQDIVKPTTLIDSADYVVMESTYGDKNHPKEDPSQILMEEINQVENTQGVLLIPAFSLERTQELLHRINHLKKEGKVRADTPVFLDSPMGIRATMVFKDFKTFYNKELQEHTDDPFSFEGLVITEEARDSKEIIKAMEPKVIIAGSGMLSGGRILHHAEHYLSRKNTRLLFVGFQSEETLGRKISEGAKNAYINDRQVKVNATIRHIESLSSHADEQKLIDWLKHIKGVNTVFLTHGEQMQQEVLTKGIKDQLSIPTIIAPTLGQIYTFSS